MENNIQFFQMSMDDLKALIKEAVKSGTTPPINNTNGVNTTSSSDDGKEWYTREEVKDLLKVSFTTLWKYNKEGVLKAKKIGSRVYYLKTDLFNLLNNAA
ncbi:helix-turn-helix domain-containing protein [Mariniflexile sp. HNIBRBA6329]|uniref:helix-turn-helix domain-containing protein n=1 Tax=Mariniflexile sp. HNIBRBA6329 TaxID=3373088 RepID=UPI00374633DF